MPVRGFLGLGFSAAMAAVMLGPIGKAIARQLSGESQGRSLTESTGQFDALMGELQALREDMAQIHERMDFTERLLAQRTERPALPREG
jgi:Tfp pilus assembly protein PilO